jgi:hypothetical protein
VGPSLRTEKLKDLTTPCDKLSLGPAAIALSFASRALKGLNDLEGKWKSTNRILYDHISSILLRVSA